MQSQRQQQLPLWLAFTALAAARCGPHLCAVRPVDQLAPHQAGDASLKAEHGLVSTQVPSRPRGSRCLGRRHAVLRPSPLLPPKLHSRCDLSCTSSLVQGPTMRSGMCVLYGSFRTGCRMLPGTAMTACCAHAPKTGHLSGPWELRIAWWLVAGAWRLHCQLAAQIPGKIPQALGGCAQQLIMAASSQQGAAELYSLCNAAGWSSLCKGISKA